MNTPVARENKLPTSNMQNATNILKTDIIVPYMSLGQGLSKFVTERKVHLGDIYRSTTGEVLGNPDKPIDAIFLHYPKADWLLEQKGKARFEFRGTEPRTAANETLPWSFYADDDMSPMEPGTKGASEWRRVKRLTVFALLPADIKAAKAEMDKAMAGELPDPSKALTPVAFSFRSTGYNTGKEICTFYTQAQTLKVPIWRYSLPMFDALEQNDEGSFYVWKTDRTKAKGVDKELLPLVEEWVQMIGNVSLNVHDEGDSDTSSGIKNERATKEVC